MEKQEKLLTIMAVKYVEIALYVVLNILLY